MVEKNFHEKHEKRKKIKEFEIIKKLQKNH